MKACDSLSYQAVDGDEGKHQDTTLQDSKDTSTGEYLPAKQVDLFSQSTHNQDEEEEQSVYSCPSSSKSKDFNFDNFVNSSQFALALDILRWFQSEKLSHKPHLLKDAQIDQLREVTKKHNTHHQDLLNTTSSTTGDIMDIDKYYELPKPKATKPSKDNAAKPLPKEESSDVKADEILKKLISKIEAKYRRPKRSFVTDNESTTTTEMSTTMMSSTSSEADHAQLITLMKSRKHRSKPKEQYYRIICENESKSKKKKDKKSTTSTAPQKIYVKDQAIQTESLSEPVPKELSLPIEQQRKKQLCFADGIRPGSSMSACTYTAEEEDGDDTFEVESEVEDRLSDMNKNEEEKSAPTFQFKNRTNLAWYEPISTRKLPEQRPCKKTDSLQDLLVRSKPDFVSRLKERQRLLSITAEERKLQAMWRAERQKLFGHTVKSKQQRPATVPFPAARAPLQLKKRAPMSRAEMIQYSRDRYSTLPEVKERKVNAKRKQEYAAYRENQRRFNKKVQNQVLKNTKWQAGVVVTTLWALQFLFSLVS